MGRGVRLGWKWSPRRASRAYRLCAWSCLRLLWLTHLGLQVLELYLIADDGVGLCHVLRIDFIVGVLGVGDLGVGGEEVLVDVLVQLLRSTSTTLMLLMLIR